VAFGTPTCSCLLSAFFLGFAGTAQGATPQNTPGITDLIRDRQDRLLEEQQRCPCCRRRPPNRCFAIKTIELTGADALKAAASLIASCL
jgi:hemolysin activation/secretion protein